ncbi:MAG: transcriptional repressor [Alphaproteobacteria bacterium]|jgi:Fur family zinc uptake transcriptional regulator|uniref:Fur family transcriptional regulator n=2 Tax=Brevundimonas sp. TaxID=1871086 RepID=UPI0012074F29|nr:Fur family transcriptional regulator [Brevundimonas sp.]MBU3973703.1 transcriptional repressor [Alphaproteobacteria bacterium]MBU4038398.1 transcriptional repressor [Alphaproteobacteria bacterium]TAJ56660.1 MAG: transcriptional repressor [Brevundimonas sp.]
MSDSCGHHHPDGPPAAAAVARAMQDADRRLTAEGERMTPPRLRVLELLLAAGEPVKAYDLIARFGEDGQPAKPPTVYRALEFLERKGLAHRIASISAYVACTSGAADHAAAFLICDCCGATAEVSAPVADDLGRAAESAGYAIDRTTIEAHGRCPACR